MFHLWVRSISPRRSRGAGGLVVRESLGTTSQLGVSGAYQIDPDKGLGSPQSSGKGAGRCFREAESQNEGEVGALILELIRKLFLSLCKTFEQT